MGFDFSDRAGLHRAELIRHIGMSEVVDARRAATAFVVAELDDAYLRDSVEERARLEAHLLAVCEMAGILVRDAYWHRSWRSDEVRRQKFGDIADANGEALGAIAPSGIVAQEHAVALQLRAAAGGVDQDQRGVAGF